MPPKRSASATVTKPESPSRRKVGRPKKMETDSDGEEEEGDEDPEASLTPRRRGARRKTKGIDKEEEGDNTANVVTLSMDDLIEIPAELEPSSPKKRKAPAKSPATKKSKIEAAVKDVGGAGDVENLIQCSLCDAKVVQLVRHIRAQHGDDPDYDSKIKEARTLEAKVQSAVPKKSGTSSLLDDLTITVNKMERTPVVDRRTTGERGNSLVRPKNTQCPICEKVVRRYDLNKHIRNVHSGEKPNKCPYCDYASPWKGNLNTHVAGVHTKARLHDCVRCGLSFKTRSAMIGHVRKVHDKMYQPKERLFECEECSKKFYKKFHLQRHIRVHTGEKPFTCAFCEKMFASKTNMDSHIQSVHLKIKPFKCGYCEKGFARKKMMLVHIRKYHMNKEDAGLMGLSSIDDITLDDTMDNDSDGSVESGEILAGEDGMPDSGMVLVKMRGDAANAESDAVKQYMLVPSGDMPSDLDSTMDTSAGDQSLLLGDTAASTAKSPAAASGSGTNKATKGKNKPVVINVGAGQVVQAVQTKDGIMLVTQPASSPAAKAAVKAAEKQSAAKNAASDAADESAAETTEQQPAEAQQPVEAQQPATQEKVAAPVVDAEASAEAAEVAEAPAVAAMPATAAMVPPADGEAKVADLDLVGQAMEQAAVPEAVGAKAGLMSSAETDLIGGLPANLLATEEAEQVEPQVNDGAKTVETFFLNDIQTNGGGPMNG